MSARGTGLEFGVSRPDFWSGYSDASALVVLNTNPHSGFSHLRISTGAGTNWGALAAPDGTTNELYISFWMDLQGTGKGFRAGVILSDATKVYLQKDPGVGNTAFDAYVDGVMVASGSEAVPNGAYGLVELRILIDGSAGVIQSKIGGVVDIAFSGDTLPGAATTITDVYWEPYNAPADILDIDDITFDTDDWPGDIRYSRIPPNGDTATIEWTAGAGAGDNYQRVDSDNEATYNYSDAVDEQDIYDITNWTNGKQIYVVCHYIRAKYVTAACTINALLISGATTEQVEHVLTSSFAYYRTDYRLDPNTGAQWITADFNALTVGQESVSIGASAQAQVAMNQFEVGYTQLSEDSKSGVLNLAMDIDLEYGTRLFFTTWENSTLYLRTHLISSLAQFAKTSFGGATSDDVANRTYFLACYAPAFWGVTGFGDYVYIFGRWNLGGVQHLVLSTDVGASFGSNLGDASWGAGWVGAFFADDANTYYAFVNGASRALWRSTDGGASWTSLSSLPFDVEAGAVSKHPDGRILISNRDAGGQTAAYAIGPNYSSWVDATGSPSFPASTPGSGSNAIIWIT